MKKYTNSTKLIYKLLRMKGILANMNTIITQVIFQNIGIPVTSIHLVGQGASGSVYEVCCNETPHKIAVKISKFPDLLQEEYHMLCFLREQTNDKIPKPYFFEKQKELAILGMEFIEGISGKDITFTSKHLNNKHKFFTDSFKKLKRGNT